MVAAPQQSLVARADAVRVIEQLAGWAATAVLPHSADPSAVAGINRLWRRTKVAEARRTAQLIQTTLPQRFDSQQADSLTAEWFRRRAELAWGRLRGLHASGWRVRLDVEGLDHLAAAREQGKGAVVWYMSFCESFLLMRAMAEAGVPVAHLSLLWHGVPGRSRFGVATAGRLYRAAEDRYLQVRVVMQDTASPSYFKKLAELLASNHAVTIRGDLAEAGSSVRAACLDRTCAFAVGAPRLAFQTKAPLLTAYAERLAPFHYRVVFQEAIAADRGTKKTFVEQAVAEYGRRLDEQLANNSPDWEGWWWIARLVKPTQTAVT
jgi:lauroyl/myristoyl acyltransferase